MDIDFLNFSELLKNAGVTTNEILKIYEDPQKKIAISYYVSECISLLIWGVFVIGSLFFISTHKGLLSTDPEVQGWLFCIIGLFYLTIIIVAWAFIQDEIEFYREEYIRYNFPKYKAIKQLLSEIKG